MIDLKHGDCLEVMKDIPDGTVDMVLVDPPYGVTACKWDTVIPLEPLWEEYERIIKKNGVILIFGTEPFSSTLRMSNKKMYRYDWIWEKSKASNFINSKKMPMRKHEIISVFYKKLPTYNPQWKAIQPYTRDTTVSLPIYGMGKPVERKNENLTGKGYPTSIIYFQQDSSKGNNSERKKNSFHPTQKPVLLLEYLIKTYTNEGETVLDNCMGSGSTGVACINTGRDFIGIEKDDHYFEVAKNRIEEHQQSQQE